MNEQRRLEICKQAMKDKINIEAKALLNSFTTDYSEWEAMAWEKLRQEAEQFQLDGTIGEYMAAEIGVKYDAPTLASTVLTKAASLRAARAAVILERQQKEMAIDAATTLAELNYVF